MLHQYVWLLKLCCNIICSITPFRAVFASEGGSLLYLLAVDKAVSLALLLQTRSDM